MTRLVVEVHEFVKASNAVYEHGSDPVWDAMLRRDRGLVDTGSMAGTDPGGVSWAASYNRAAAAAAHATVDAVAATDRLAARFAQAGRNYAAADVASTAATRGTISADLASLDQPWHVGGVQLPPAAEGGSSHLPAGWSLVAGALHQVWPNGHQDKLHAAADAWTAAASTISQAAVAVGCAGLFSSSDIPEHDDMMTVCTRMTDHLTVLHDVHATLAHTCRELAHHLDTCHSEVIGELRDLVEWTAGSEIIGGILAAATAGGSEVVANGALALRIARVAAKVDELLGTFAAAARALADTIPTLTAAAERIRGVFAELSGSRLAIAGMDDVGALPGAARAAKAGSAGVRLTKEAREEAAAARRLSRKVGGLGSKDPRTPPTLVGRRYGDPGHWKNKVSLRRHFRDHAQEVGARTPEEYASKSSDLLQRALNEHLPRKFDPKHGVTRVWDPQTNEFGSYAPDGRGITYFKPDSPTYFERQPGVPR